jgi:hypothetical protein
VNLLIVYAGSQAPEAVKVFVLEQKQKHSPRTTARTDFAWNKNLSLQSFVVNKFFKLIFNNIFTLSPTWEPQQMLTVERAVRAFLDE